MLAKSVPGLRNPNFKLRIHVDVSEDGIARFWDHHHYLQARKTLPGVEVVENLLSGVSEPGHLLRKRHKQNPGRCCRRVSSPIRESDWRLHHAWRNALRHRGRTQIRGQAP